MQWPFQPIICLSILKLSSPSPFSDWLFLMSLNPALRDLSFPFHVLNCLFALLAEYLSRSDSYLGRHPVAFQTLLSGIDDRRSFRKCAVQGNLASLSTALSTARLAPTFTSPAAAGFLPAALLAAASTGVRFSACPTAASFAGLLLFLLRHHSLLQIKHSPSPAPCPCFINVQIDATGPPITYAIKLPKRSLTIEAGPTAKTEASTMPG